MHECSAGLQKYLAEEPDIFDGDSTLIDPLCLQCSEAADDACICRPL